MRSLWKTFEAGAIRDGVVASVVAVDLPRGSNALLKQLGEILGVESLHVHGPLVYLSLHTARYRTESDCRFTFRHWKMTLHINSQLSMVASPHSPSPYRTREVKRMLLVFSITLPLIANIGT